MSNHKSLRTRFIHTQAAWRRRRRLWFPSPAELRFIRIMGGRVIILPILKDRRTGFPLAIIVTLGRTLKRERINREVRVGRYYIDFGVTTPYYSKGVEIDGAAFHQDVLKEHERDLYCADYGWRLLHIQARDLHTNPAYVRRRVLQFLAK